MSDPDDHARPAADQPPRAMPVPVPQPADSPPMDAPPAAEAAVDTPATGTFVTSSTVGTEVADSHGYPEPTGADDLDEVDRGRASETDTTDTEQSATAELRQHPQLPEAADAPPEPEPAPRAEPSAPVPGTDERRAAASLAEPTVEPRVAVPDVVAGPDVIAVPDAPVPDTAAPDAVAGPDAAAPDVVAGPEAADPRATDPAATADDTGEAAPHSRSEPDRNSRPGRPGGSVTPPAGRPGLLAAPAGQPDARPGQRPGVVPRPRPSGRRPGSPAVEPMVESMDPHKWGRIDETGAVFVYSSTGERQVGNWQAGDAEAGLAHYGRRYDDVYTEIAILEKRLANGSGDPKATRAQAVALRDSVDTLAAIGDLDSAAVRLEIVIGAADAALAGASQARTAARNRAIAAKEALCTEAESLTESTAWKATGDRLKQIVEEWRTIHGIDRKTDDTLWKRFAKARDTFTKHRGTHFADLDKQRGAAREAKEKLIARAEEISKSDDWGQTAGEYRTLMDEWKSSGRAPREIEDQLWQRFRAAQESFFSRRNSTFSQRDSEFETNASTKEKLLAEAERIDPAQGLDQARAALRSIQERWESAGKVPRERIREFDTRLRTVEERIKRAQDSHWRRTDPETVARVEQFRTRAEGFRTQATKARAAGDETRAAQAETQAQQWEEWLATAEGSVQG